MTGILMSIWRNPPHEPFQHPKYRGNLPPDWIEPPPTLAMIAWWERNRRWRTYTTSETEIALMFGRQTLPWDN